MATLEEVKSVVKKISSVGDLRNHICFFGGAMPYIFHNQDSNREHSDIDVLVEVAYLDAIRQLLKNNNLYRPELDSLNLGLDQDYGFKVFIDGVYVEFEPMIVANNALTRLSFSPNRELAGSEAIPFVNIEDLITPVNVDGITTFTQSMELIKVSKEKYNREKDLQDIAFIESKGIDMDKHHRVQLAMKEAETIMSTYEDLRIKKK